MKGSLRIALGSATYRVERPFGDFIVGRALVSDVACDSKGHVFVLLRSDPADSDGGDPIVELDTNGHQVSSFGAGQVLDAHMLAIDDRDRLFVVDRDAHQIVIFDRLGNVLGAIGERHAPGQPFSHPSSVAFGPDGSIYVADGYGATKVHRFNADVECINTWGERGSNNGSLITPHGIWVISDGRVLVADRENDRIQVYSHDGQFLAQWPNFPRAMDIWSDSDDNIYVSDLVPRLTRLDKAGKVTGCSRPVLNVAHGISGDKLGRIYLAEVSPSRITRLSPDL